jgi:hypothetical protein
MAEDVYECKLVGTKEQFLGLTGRFEAMLRWGPQDSTPYKQGET